MHRFKGREGGSGRVTQKKGGDGEVYVSKGKGRELKKGGGIQQ